MRIRSAVILAALLAGLTARSALCAWDNYAAADGLVSNYVYAMVEDRAGNLWFGTAQGVSRYDGATWETYTTADGLASNLVSDILEDRAGNLWFATYDMGVSRYDGENWVTFTTTDGLAHNDVRAILEDRAGNLWFGTGGGVSRYDGADWTTYTAVDGLAGNFVVALLEDRTGALWFGTSGAGVSRYDGANWTTYTAADGLAGNYVAAILQDDAGGLWFATSEGVSRYDGISWQTHTTADGLVYDNTWTIMQDRVGDLWFGTVQGVSRYDGSTWRTYTPADGLSHNNVRRILQDSSGNMWFGTIGGVSRNDGVAWETYTTADGLANNYLSECLEDDTGNLWFGTHAGVSRYDGTSWVTYTTADGLAWNEVSTIMQDSAGNIWFGTMYGLSRYDGLSWQSYSTSPAGASVRAICEDHAGNIWFGTDDGLVRYDGVEWRVFTTADGLVSNDVWAIQEDRLGNLWFGTRYGLTRYDGLNWVTYTAADGLAGDFVDAILEDRNGNLWFGTFQGGGVSRYDGVIWRTFSEVDGLVSNSVLDIAEDRAGNIWFATGGGASRYDGTNWLGWTSADGLAGNWVWTVLEDHAGDLWFGTWGGGVTRHTPDRVAPKAVMRRCPMPLSGSTTQSVDFAAGFREAVGIEFSHSLDGSPWSEWDSANLWFGTDLVEGEHVFRARARDRVGNVDTTAAECTFEIDATPPMPVVVFPTFGSAVRDSVVIRGRATDDRFKKWSIDARAVATDSWETLCESSVRVEDGALYAWNTLPLSDGSYELRLSVVDTLGLLGFAFVQVTVDNLEPWAYETSPAKVSVADGGDVHAADGEARLYFPPHAFAREVEVRIDSLSDSAVPDTLESDAVGMSVGYEISWGGAVLQKAATLEMECPDWQPLDAGGGTTQDPAYAKPALYVCGVDSTWRRVGGTVEEGGGSSGTGALGSTRLISAAITEPGRYALFLEPPGAGASGASTLSALSLTPRVFAPNGTFANDHVAIGFTLGRSVPVTVKVYNRAGRLVRELVSGETMGAGANLVRWDGRDDNSETSPDGLYIISVEAMGQRETKTISVVR